MFPSCLAFPFFLFSVLFLPSHNPPPPNVFSFLFSSVSLLFLLLFFFLLRFHFFLSFFLSLFMSFSCLYFLSFSFLFLCFVSIFPCFQFLYYFCPLLAFVSFSLFCLFPVFFRLDFLGPRNSVCAPESALKLLQGAPQAMDADLGRGCLQPPRHKGPIRIWDHRPGQASD